MKAMRIILLIAATISPARGADDNPVSVSKIVFVNNIYDLIVTSHTDGLVLARIMINRGNCEASFLAPDMTTYPTPLNFGQRFRTRVTLGCNPIEVQVTTNHELSTFSWPAE